MENITTFDLLIPSNARIQEAEDLRKKGLYPEAFVLMQGVLFIKAEDLFRLETKEKRRFLSGLRICFGAMFSKTKLEVNPFSLKAGLLKCREILSVYEYVAVKAMASTTKFGIFDEPYDYQGEMARDISRYLAFVMELRGFGSLSLARNLEALAEKATEPTLKTLMRFEAAQNEYEYHDSTANLAILFQCAQAAVAASLNAKNFERAATIAARFYAIVPIDPFAEFSIKSFDTALTYDSSLVSIWYRETQKPLKKRWAKRIRRIFFRLFPLDWNALSVSIN